MSDAAEWAFFRSSGEPGLESFSSGGTSRAVMVLLRLVTEALEQEATDIHIEPEGAHTVVRFRVDGFLREVAAYDTHLGKQLMSCVKVLCNMDITRKERFQDGSFKARRGESEVDFRVSSVQEVEGDKVVIRVLNLSLKDDLIETLGMSADMIRALRGFATRNQGTLICAGPTGAGKTTTLYAILQVIDRTQRNVVSIEDPVEYHLPRMTQLHVDTRRGMTFGQALRSVLRQDPNVIMVGEVRDEETAQVALQSALTGHLILTSTHSKDAVGALFRLTDLQVPAYHLVTAVDIVVAQRLARKLCERCKQPFAVEKRYFEMLGFPVPNALEVYRAQGCGDCAGTGYRGRVGIFELLLMDDRLREAVLRKAPESEMAAIQSTSPFPRLLADAMGKVEAGLLSMEELSRVLG